MAASEPVWGRIDAAHVFCEPKYATSPHVAEFYNAASSLVYVVAGGVGLALARRWALDWRIQAGWVALVVVGVGSVLFHATMRFAMELCDEIPMLFLVLAFLVGKEDCVGFMSGPAGRRRFRLVALALIAVSVVSYVALFVYEIFVYSFGLAVLFEIGLDLACRPKTWQTRACFGAAVACIGTGYAIWQLEQNLCAQHPRLWPLHMVWHLLSCLGGVFAIVHNVFLRKEKLRSEHSHSPPPFVHAAAAPAPSGDSGTMTATEAGDAGRSGGDSGT
jgi:dihydroceramidase